MGVSMVEKMLEDCKMSTYQRSPLQIRAAAEGQKTDHAKEKITDPAKFVGDVMKTQGISVFSKTYCPYCQKALNIMKEANVEMTVYQLDLLQEPANGPVQQELNKITGTMSVPQIFVGGKFIGQASDIEKLKGSGTLKETLEKNVGTFFGEIPSQAIGA